MLRTLSKKTILRESLNAILIVLGVFSAGLGLKGFLLSSHFIDGGVTGISMLLSHVLGIPLSLLILLINLPFIALAYRQIGLKFAIKSTLTIAGLSLCLTFVQYPDVTPDKLLTAVFGGFFIGAGIGLAIRGGAVLDGTDIVALLISKNSNLLKVGDVILLMNLLIFAAAAFFLGIESALYSVLTYLAASKTVDFLINGIEEYTAVIIVSEKSDEIRESIVRVLNRGVTVYKGRGGKTGKEMNILYCVVTRLEIGSVKNVATETDESAFILVHPLADVVGGIIKKPALH
ncbi:YitT family protein [Oryzomonas japonica]|uniref:YitT family protein n=1 Tax=Oryzomonas japonica TaxID=2603858 RepID=A0A7J4ZM25_9BACT|nr:YitT family protein [Oryzomonas japonica]KAB0663706.1 YitT family protein [Oryzomonas japonica]